MASRLSRFGCKSFQATVCSIGSAVSVGVLNGLFSSAGGSSGGGGPYWGLVCTGSMFPELPPPLILAVATEIPLRSASRLSTGSTDTLLGLASSFVSR